MLDRDENSLLVIGVSLRVFRAISQPLLPFGATVVTRSRDVSRLASPTSFDSRQKSTGQAVGHIPEINRSMYSAGFFIESWIALSALNLLQELKDTILTVSLALSGELLRLRKARDHASIEFKASIIRNQIRVNDRSSYAPSRAALAHVSRASPPKLACSRSR